MAKIGNEAKLILRLAKERADVWYRKTNLDLDREYVRGVNCGILNFARILDDIVHELEVGK